MQKTIGAHLDTDEVAFALRVQDFHGTNGRTAFRQHAAKRSKIVRAQQLARAGVKAIEIDRRPHVKGVSFQQRRRLARVVDCIHVRAIRRGKTRGEGRIDFFDAANADV